MINCESVARMRVKHLLREKQREVTIDYKYVAKEQRNPKVCTVLNVERQVKNAVSLFFLDIQ
jgi:hypothetical protein